MRPSLITSPGGDSGSSSQPATSMTAMAATTAGGGHVEEAAQRKRGPAAPLNLKILPRRISNVDPPKVRTGMLGAASNLVNAILGAGERRFEPLPVLF